MNYLVLGRKAGLFHLAHWLTGESEPGAVRAGTLNLYAGKHSWKGILDRVETFHGLSEIPEGTALVTDDYRWTGAAEGPVPVWGTLRPGKGLTKSPIALGGWWDGALKAPHWVLTDWGLWPGGLGAGVVGGFCLVSPGRVSPPVDLLDEHQPRLAGFRGPLTLDLSWDPEAPGWRSGALRAGWEGWHGLSLVQGSPSARALFEGTSEPTLAPFTACIPVSVPPFPFSAPNRPAGALQTTPETERSLVLGDVARDRAGLIVGGVDGAVALAIGKGRMPGTARSQAVQIAQSLQLGEGQFRPDTGQGLEVFLSGLERIGWF